MMLEIRQLTKQFGDVVAVSDVGFEVQEGEFVTILGPSGSGKTTVLRIVAGLTEPTGGTISIAGRDVTSVPPQKRGIGLVFQSYALFPNMNVSDNIAFPLRIRKWPRAELQARVDELLSLVGLENRRLHTTDALSGGERQRVALARALAFRPPLLVLDEPFSSLDAKVRENLRQFLKDIQRTTGVTTLMVTHDQEEALELSDRIVVMNNGCIEQIGTPRDVYYFPQTRFTAQFIGTVNTLSTKLLRVRRAKGGLVGSFEWNGTQFDWTLPDHQAQPEPGEESELHIRPESIDVSLLPREGFRAAEVVFAKFAGAVMRLGLRVGDEILTADTVSATHVSPPTGGTVHMRITDRRIELHDEKTTGVTV